MTDLREDLARALMDADEKWRGLPWSGLSPRVQKLFLRDADAAIALLWPRAMEMAAKVAERFDAGMKHRDEQQRIADHTARDIATAIRSTGAPTK